MPRLTRRKESPVAGMLNLHQAPGSTFGCIWPWVVRNPKHKFSPQNFRAERAHAEEAPAGERCSDKHLSSTSSGAGEPGGTWCVPCVLSWGAEPRGDGRAGTAAAGGQA